MRMSRTFALLLASGAWILAGCNSGSNMASNPPVSSPPPAATAALNVSMRDMPMMNGFDILAFRATVTGAVLQPGNIPVIASPMTIEMTQLQSMSAYLNTISVPAGNYTGMTITFANPQMTFLNGTGVGGMMSGGYCSAGQICQYAPATLTASQTISGAPFPLSVQAGTPLGLMMDFDLSGSFQGTTVWNMGFSPMMSSFLQQPFGSSGAFGQMFDQMNEVPGVVTSVDSASQQFTMQFVEGAPTLTIHVDDKTVYDGFDSIGKANSFSSLVPGQIVVVDLDLEGAGTLYAGEVELENNSGNELYGMLVGLDSAGGWCDFVVMNEAPDFSGVLIGDVVRASLQPGTNFDVNFQDMPMGGFNFGGYSDLMLGQMMQFAPLSGLTSGSGTPPQVNVNHLRLMSTWATGTISQTLSSTDFMFTPTSGIFPAAGIHSLHVSTSAQTRFDNVSGLGGLNVGDTVSLRGPMFTGTTNPMLMAGYILKR